MCIYFSHKNYVSNDVFDSHIGFSVISNSMVSVERTEARGVSPSYFKKDGSYTGFGVRMEISKHIIQVPNHPNSLNLIAQAKGLKVVPRLPEIPQGIAFLCSPDVKTHKEPARHNNNSSAEYVIDWHRYKSDDGRENIIWLSRIPPNEGTSKPPHTHGIGIDGRGIFEHYLRIAGTAYINDGKSTRSMGEYEVVPPSTEHYIEAGEEGAIFFILIENAGGIPDDKIHILPTV